MAAATILKNHKNRDITTTDRQIFAKFGTIMENQICLTVWAVKRPILLIHAKFRENLPIRCCEIEIFVFFQDGGRRHIGF